MPTYTFPPVKAQARRRIDCLGCGKRCNRQATFEMTVSPFNQNPDGTVRTRAEVHAAVQAEAQAWNPTLCGTCEPEHRPARFAVKRDEFEGDCVCGNRWPCLLTEDYARLKAQLCLCQPVGRICARCIRLGLEFDKVVRCCEMHQADGCCDPDDCGPCCERCPTCPTLKARSVPRAARSSAP